MMEDHLEYLCELLTTVGKYLDHRDAKVNYFYIMIRNNLFIILTQKVIKLLLSNFQTSNKYLLA